MRVAVLSFWHVHGKDYANEAVAHPGTELVAIWDEDATRGQAMATQYGVEFIADYTVLLARTDIDGVIVTSPTNMHRSLCGILVRSWPSLSNSVKTNRPWPARWPAITKGSATSITY